MIANTSWPDPKIPIPPTPPRPMPPKPPDV